MNTEMTAEDVITIINLLFDNDIKVHVDGGWGVDALLGKQTRPHADLDIAIRHKGVPKLRKLLESRGYKEIPRNDSWECNFLMADEAGRQIDVHSYTFNAEGENIYGVSYPAESLTGNGTIEGHQVHCISAEWVVRFHAAYKPDINDYRDVSALCERFGIEFPEEYNKFRKT